MKITHTIIRNGISRGIPEGTKVPEKPTRSILHDRFLRVEWRKKMEVYKKDFQALWDSSVEWEDQYTALRLVTAPIQNKVTGEFDDGIYPLEGVNAERVWQKADCGKRVDCAQQMYRSQLTYKTYDVRTVLRLIPYPNSEQKIPCCGNQTCWDRGQCHGDPCDPRNKVEGTEVSEPLDTRTMQIAYAQAMAKPGCDVGVDEKKEPETGPSILTHGDNTFNVGVSEGEVTIEEIEAVLLAEGSSSLIKLNKSEAYLIARRLRQYFHIQKLKP